MATPNETSYDVAIVGGGYAGMSAALQLLRAHRSVVIIDAGKRRNRFAAHSYGFLTHDGASPDDIAETGRKQLDAYPTLTWREGSVNDISGEQGDFTLRVDSGDDLSARIVILAVGVVDQFPAIEGLQERWGTTVFNCPYCHGYELGQGKIAVIATGEGSFDQAMMMPEWGEVTLFVNEEIELDDVQTRALDIRQVDVEATPIRRIHEKASIELSNGNSMEFNGIAITTTTTIPDVVRNLGCDIEEDPEGPHVKVDDEQATSVEGVFACGDISRSTHSIAYAVADGADAGKAAHTLLMQTD